LATDLTHQKEQLDEYINKFNEDRDCRITPLEEEKSSLVDSKEALEK
jgi:hypothetical protein